MVEHHNIALHCKSVNLKLLLECKYRQQIVKSPLLLGSKYELVELGNVVSVLVYPRVTLRVRGNLVMVGEGNDVLTKATVVLECLLGCIVALVQRTLYAGVGVKVGALPANSAVEVVVWIEYIIAAEWLGSREVIDKRNTRRNNSQRHYQQ